MSDRTSYTYRSKTKRPKVQAKQKVLQFSKTYTSFWPFSSKVVIFFVLENSNLYVAVMNVPTVTNAF